MMNERSLHLTSVQFHYKEQILLSIDDMQLHSYGIHIVAGKNGAGKSLFMHLASGRVPPSIGEVYLKKDSKQVDLYRSISSRYDIRLLSDDFIGDVREKVFTYLFEVATAYVSQRGNALCEEVVRVLKIVDLIALQHEKIERLSFGQRRRLSMAVVLLGKPHFLFLDEPFTGVDMQHIKHIQHYLNKISQDTCIIMTMHDIDLCRNIPLHALLFVDEGSVSLLQPTADNLERMAQGLQADV
ncbi:ATP-binding cassette domain-containing protein [Entomospira nematocerorum]|uniref:ATP-binding cassette domain-containing protein n=1 Tax=Entomospira nematocerorum TaxID=2719987 RepID=A0A968GC62_9SPIO|nr:ATP-binding cassette domain-containing protein [Entomospira nematocera]NIZ47182.1 ATP-binding cassette domain-containing protein [Entomospira nematocera]WDI34275.1 ATP-binding cassette domain-containing protein [Entomospira nematocera]